MRSRLVIVGNVFVEGSTQVTSVEDDQVVEAFSAYGPDDSLNVTILPRAAIGRENLTNPRIVHANIEILPELLVLVADEYRRRSLNAKCGKNLSGGPFSSGCASNLVA